MHVLEVTSRDGRCLACESERCKGVNQAPVTGRVLEKPGIKRLVWFNVITGLKLVE